MNIGVPIAGPAGQTLGVMNASINVSDLLTPFRQGQLTSGARVTLVNEDGKIVSGPNADYFARLSSPEFDFVRDALGSNKGEQNGWVMADLAGGQSIVGFASTGLKQHFTNLGWVVTVSQAEHQAAASIRSLGRFAIVMVILALFMLTLLCVYYYIHRTQRIAHLEEQEFDESGHRHPGAAPIRI